MVAGVGVCYIGYLPCSHVELQEHILVSVGNGSVRSLVSLVRSIIVAHLHVDLLISRNGYEVEGIPSLTIDRGLVGISEHAVDRGQTGVGAVRLLLVSVDVSLAGRSGISLI